LLTLRVCVPRRFRAPANGAVSAAGLPFLLIPFLWARKEKNAPPGRETKGEEKR